MSAPLRVITLADGRRVKEVPEVNVCQGCMFIADCEERDGMAYDGLDGCSIRHTIYQPANPEQPKTEPVGYLWRHAGTGRTRLVDPDCVITTQPGGWELVGPLVLANQGSVKREPLTDEQVASAFNGWEINHAQESRENSGAWELGNLNEDDIFSPLITVDAGLYYMPQHSEPMARALLAAIQQPHHAQPAQREPLTDEQIARLWSEAYDDATGRRQSLVLARAIERAHGIGQQDGREGGAE